MQNAKSISAVIRVSTVVSLVLLLMGQFTSISNAASWMSNGNHIYYSPGSVGIGVQNPTKKLDVAGDMKVRGNGDNAQIVLRTWNGKEALIGMQDDGDQGFYVHTGGQYRLSVNNNGNVGINTTTPTARLEVFQDAGFGETAIKSTSVNGVGVQGLSGDGAGVYGVAAVGYGIYGEGHEVAKAGYFDGDVVVTGTFSNPSDIKFKKDIKSDVDGLSMLSDLKVKSYEYKTEEYADSMGFPEGQQYGLIAQDVEDVLPELVNEVENMDGESYKTVNYLGLIPLLTESIQEQQEVIDSQESEIEKLKELVCLDHSDSEYCS